MIAVLKRRHTIHFLEYILEIRLAGEAEVIADLAQCLIGISEQTFRLFETASHNKAAYIKAQFLFKLACQVGTAPADMFRDIANLDWLIDVVGDELDAFKDLRRHVLWDLILCNTLREVGQHAVVQCRNLRDVLGTLTFLNIDVG